MKREIRDERSRGHRLSPSPSVEQIWIAVKELAVEELIRHRAAAHEFADKRGPHSLDVIASCPVCASGAEQPVAVIERVLDGVPGWLTVLINEFAAELKVVGGHGHGIGGTIGRR